MRIERAASGRAGCRSCGAKIARSAVRVGREAEGDWGVYYQWHHLACVGSTFGDATRFEGFRSLPADIRRAIQRKSGACQSPTFGADPLVITAPAPEPAALPPSMSQQRPPARPALAARGVSVTGGATQQTVGGDVWDDEFGREVFYGQFEGDIVGCRYYGGIAHAGEYVALVREPNNPYDANAVRVDNLGGQQVGHIKRGIAMALRRILDNVAPGAPRIEATIPREASNIFSMKVALQIYGSPFDMAWVMENMRLAGIRLQRGAAAAAIARPGGQGAQDASPGTGRGALGSSYEFNPAKTEKELNELFDQLAEASPTSCSNFDASPLLLSDLREHQRAGVAWMLSREHLAPESLPTFFEEREELGKRVFHNTITATSSTARPAPCFGGLLADDMGNGKTLQVLAVVLSNPPPGVVYEARAAVEVPGDASADVAAPAVPKAEQPATATQPAASDPFATTWVLMLDKVREIWGREPSASRDLLVLSLPQLRELCVVSGAKKSGNKDAIADRAWAKLCEAGGVAALYDGNVEPSTQPPAKRQKTHDGGKGAAKSIAKAKGKGTGKQKVGAGVVATCARGTLIVAPVSVLENWVTQIQEHIAPGALDVFVWHGAGRHKNAQRLRSADVVITSYSTLSGELAEHEAYLDACSRGAKPPPPQGALSMHWHRAVLDEAHTVRNRQSKAFKAVCALHARLRWALTGTPIQNSAFDVYGVLAFLGAPPLNEPQIFNRAIGRPIREGDPAGLARLRLLLMTISLRRPKSVLGAELPKKTIQVQKVILDQPHRECYGALFDSARVAVAAALQLGTAQEHYMGILECLMRLRQACCACARSARASAGGPFDAGRSRQGTRRERKCPRSQQGGGHRAVRAPPSRLRRERGLRVRHLPAAAVRERGAHPEGVLPRLLPGLHYEGYGHRPAPHAPESDSALPHV